MVQVFNSKPSFWTRHVLQKPELGGRNKNDSFLGALLKGKEKDQSMPTLWWPLHTTLVLSSVNNVMRQLMGENLPILFTVVSQKHLKFIFFSSLINFSSSFITL